MVPKLLLIIITISVLQKQRHKWTFCRCKITMLTSARREYSIEYQLFRDPIIRIPGYRGLFTSEPCHGSFSDDPRHHQFGKHQTSKYLEYNFNQMRVNFPPLERRKIIGHTIICKGTISGYCEIVTTPGLVYHPSSHIETT